MERAKATPRTAGATGWAKPTRRRVSAEDREVEALLIQIDTKLKLLEEQTEALLRDMGAQRGV